MAQKKVKQSSAHENGHPKPVIANYLASLAITDLRCFGPETQSLRLTDDEGRCRCPESPTNC